MKPNKHLDEQIKAALKNLKADHDPSSWEMLEERLDAPASNEPSLESFVASRLAGLEAPLHADSWSLMEQRIEAAEAADLIETEAQIDNLAYNKLHHYEVPYQSHHWSLMTRRLEEEFSLRNRLYRYKVAELALMFLILLTVVRFLPLAESYMQGKKEEGNIQEFKLTPPSHPGQAEMDEVQPQAHLNTIRGKTDIPPAKHTEINRQGINEPGNLSETVFNQPDNIEYEPQSEPAISEAIMVSPSLPQLPMPSVQALKLSGNQVTLAVGNENTHPVLPPALPSKSVSSGFLLFSDLQLVQSNSGPALILPEVMPFQKTRELRFSIFAAADYSYVFTPSDQYSVFGTQVSTDDDTTAASGYGAGILVNFKRDRWELQTGGIYSFKRYVPNTPIFLFETVRYYVEENFHGIQQDILQLPFNVQYYFKNRGNWRMYGTTGASMNFITSSVYEILYKRTPTFNLGIASAPGDENKSIRKEKEFPRGLFEGGSLEDNFYMTANIGLGVERFVSPGWSLYFQPNYHHYLMSQGIGTNKDKFYTLSFYLGTKVSLR